MFLKYYKITTPNQRFYNLITKMTRFDSQGFSTRATALEDISNISIPFGLYHENF